MNKQTIITQALDAYPEVAEYLTLTAIKAAAPMSRGRLEKNLTRSISQIDRRFLMRLENFGAFTSAAFWAEYEQALYKEISGSLRFYIGQSFSSYSDYVAFVDNPALFGDIDNMMTDEIRKVVSGISNNTRKNLDALIAQGIDEDEIIERIAYRMGGAHAEQVAITEITRAESQIAEALSSRLKEQGVSTVIRWQTSEDERVCPVCNPADHKLKDQKISGGDWNGQSWGERFPSGPPAHPNCRCKTVVELTK